MNKLIRKILFIGLGVTLLISQCMAYNELTGTTGAAVLKIPAGVRPMGMGEAFAAIADDVNSMHWNPAGLAKMQKPEFNFSYNMWLLDIGYGNVNYAHPLGALGTIGASISYLSMGTFYGMDKNGARAPDFTGYDLIVDVSYAQKLMQGLSFGGSFKFLQEKIEVEQAITWAIDAGVIYDLSEKFSLEFAVQNIGTGIQFTPTALPENLPLNIKIGCGYKPSEAMILALDVNIPNDNVVNVSAGMEYWLMSNFALRAGYKTNRLNDLGALSGLCVGFGLKWSNYAADFAFTPYGELSNCFRLSLGMVF